MMGLTCSTSVPSKSRPVSLGIPLSLHPTTLQLTTIHVSWIDRFPFPHMRDTMITMSAVIDEEEFLRDLFTSPSFTLKAGKSSWDPEAWAIEKAFAEKWGFLLF
ncbi:hypothetical protein AOQ84DRAFT_311937 [Glonium stellatum]|uniref:Uncharacterized protein n=1 Tax=Glonium stellatum TaxID=574774 RepID=A0A8E2F955_9PEZI|nr:hypothetical protein AOQ84DRAFT_311937 [Glonium stellatum]